MARKKIEDIIEELRSWLPNYDSRSPNDYPILLFRILASLPGGDDLEDMGYETFSLGWHEADQLARVIDAIQDKQDVEDLVRGLVYEEEEDLDEARRRRPPRRPMRPSARTAPPPPAPRAPGRPNPRLERAPGRKAPVTTKAPRKKRPTNKASRRRR